MLHVKRRRRQEKMGRAELVALLLTGLLLVLTNAQKQSYKRGIACQGEKVLLNKCPPRHVINIDSAKFGRESTFICPNKANYTTICGLIDVRHKVKAICDERVTCSFPADPNLLGDEGKCSHVSKYLITYYTCVPLDDNMMDECSNPSVDFDPDHDENTVQTLDTYPDDATKFSVRHNNSAFDNKPALFLSILGVLGTIYSLN